MRLFFIGVVLFVVASSHSPASSQDTSCLSLDNCGHDPFADDDYAGQYQSLPSYNDWLDSIGDLGGCGSSSGLQRCPGESITQCKDRCDTLVESIEAGCRALTSAYDRALCWADAMQYRAQCYRDCES